jgi:exodeoxyribonuclease-3
MKIITWNVNGLRAMLKKKDFNNLLDKEKPDVFCMGETKLSKDYDMKDNILDNFKYHYFSNSKKRKGYSGTAILTNIKPLNVIYNMIVNNINYDDEGRVIVLEYKSFYLLHVYTPNSGAELKRLKERTELWDNMFIKYILTLQEKKPVIVCGDLNVAHSEIDLKNPDSNHKTAGFTIQERNNFTMLLDMCNMVDIYRNLHPTQVQYTYWSYRQRARRTNAGWRIDYYLVSKKLLKKVINSSIMDNIMGSDHAPIKLEILI